MTTTATASAPTTTVSSSDSPSNCRGESHCVSPLRTTPTVLECSPSSSLPLAPADMDASTSSLSMSSLHHKQERASGSTPDMRDDQQTFTPYPFHQRSKEEIDDFNQLELSFGEDWSLQFADVVSCGSDCMSVDTDNATSFYGDEPASPMEACPEVTFVDTEELKSRRNELWKQSLKTSMFQRH